MIALLSPAKNLDYESVVDAETPLTKPAFVNEAEQLIDLLSKASLDDLQSLMNISEDLAQLNYERYKNWIAEHSEDNSRQAGLAFNGAVYKGLEAANLTTKEWQYAREHVFILSGLYGLLKTTDLIQPYRLEMGTKLKINKANNLYEFWGDKITEKINQQLEKDQFVINLASKEYIKSVRLKKLSRPMIDVSFKDAKNDTFRTIAIYAKHARGAMAREIIKNRPNHIDELKDYRPDGYIYQADLSAENHLVYTRG